jgi:hypothetical protein
VQHSMQLIVQDMMTCAAVRLMVCACKLQPTLPATMLFVCVDAHQNNRSELIAAGHAVSVIVCGDMNSQVHHSSAQRYTLEYYIQAHTSLQYSPLLQLRCKQSAHLQDVLLPVTTVVTRLCSTACCCVYVLLVQYCSLTVQSGTLKVTL